MDIVHKKHSSDYLHILNNCLSIPRTDNTNMFMSNSIDYKIT